MSLESTSKFKVDSIIYKTDAFAFALGYWEGRESLSLACRWHGDGIGYPQTYGKPQWMLMPDCEVDVSNFQDLVRRQITLKFPPAQG